MDFRETGLPFDPVVYKAFMTYMQAAPDPQQTGMPRHFSLRIARILHETKVEDPELLAAALLTELPPQTWGGVRRRFGAAVVDLLREAEQHQLSDFLHITHASERMKLLALASGVASFEEFKEVSAEFDARLGFMADGAKSQEIPVPLFENLLVFYRLLGSLVRRTSCPDLEDLYADKLDETRELQDRQIEKMKEMGIRLPPALRDGEAAQYAVFEETGLMDDPKVRAAYDIISSHMNVLPLDFRAAVQAGRLLGASPETREAATIAAALVDVGFRGMSGDDRDMLQGKLDWDVMEIIYDHSVYAIKSIAELHAAPVEFRRIALANAVIGTEEALQTGHDILELIEIEPRLPLEEKQDLLGSIRNIMLASTQLYGSLQADAPDLERAYAESLGKLRKFVEKNPPPGEPQSRPPFPRKPKDGFNP